MITTLNEFYCCNFVIIKPIEKTMTKTLKYIVQKEGKYYVSQCLNVDVSSFGKTVQEAIFNLNEALALYFEDQNAITTITPIQETLMGETRIHV